MRKNQEWSEQELKFKEMIGEMKAAYPDFWNEKPSSYDFSFLDEEKPKKSKKRFLFVAAAVFAFFVASSVMAIWMNSTSAYAVKFKLERQYYKMVGMIASSDDAEVSDENIMVFKTENESEIGSMKKVWNEILIPAYIPDSYQFEYLEIQKDVYGTVWTKYRYSSLDNNILLIAQMNSISNEVQMSWDSEGAVKIGDKSVSFWNDPLNGTNGANFNFNHSSVEILCSLENDEIIKIIDSLN